MAKAARVSLSKRTRFEVFKRDSFTCQYCGCKSPDVVLHVDHIDPVANGGDNELVNLVTSCVACNQGKSDRLLSDDTVVSRQRDQLAELQERREQLDMMLQWKTGLAELKDSMADSVCDCLFRSFGIEKPETTPQTIVRSVRRFGIDIAMDAVDKAVATYSDIDKALDKFGGICNVIHKTKSDPGFEAVSRVRSALMKSGKYVNHGELETLVREAIRRNVDIDKLVSRAWNATSWTKFINELVIFNEHFPIVSDDGADQ